MFNTGCSQYVALFQLSVDEVHRVKMLENAFSVANLVLKLQDFILEHYSEDGSQYEDSIAEFMDIRQVSAYQKEGL